MIQKRKHKQISVPPLLQHIPDAPETFYLLGSDLEVLLAKPRVAIVGSRKMTPYGRTVTEKLARELSKNGVVIVSGLAYGVDACAHQATLDSGGAAIAVLGCGLDRIYPAANERLGWQIIEKGGAIVSEYPAKTEPLKHHFLARNRIISGLADAVLITEAAEHSGSLNTAGHALNQGKPVMAVPGNITSQLSGGTNNLIKAGALPVTSVSDILYALGIDETERETPMALSKEEHIVITILKDGISDAAELLTKSDLDPAMFNQTLTMLEIAGTIKPLGNNKWTLV